MNVCINEANQKTVVSIRDRIDTSNADQFQQVVEKLINSAAKEIEIDCTGLDYTSSQGLRMFLMLQKGLMARGAGLVLVNVQPQVKEVFDITGFSSIIRIV